jgi:hypothetical protein
MLKFDEMKQSNTSMMTNLILVLQNFYGFKHPSEFYTLVFLDGNVICS